MISEDSKYCLNGSLKRAEVAELTKLSQSQFANSPLLMIISWRMLFNQINFKFIQDLIVVN